MSILGDKRLVQKKCKQTPRPSHNPLLRMRARGSPISSVSVIETCVLPALLDGAENWILTPVLVIISGGISEEILCWPKHHSNTVATLAVGLHSMKSKVLEAKLSFPQKILGVVSGRVVEAMERIYV